jgi:UDP-N-acetylglucosamine--N-acetylmuramyl-(pentapeptide) pyrophosphoryl-undecaprenol N-acetylglucosamine transferase
VCRSPADPRDNNSQILVGFGGYVSIPAYLAARRSGLPFVVHEANARPGVANRVGARLTPFVAENYSGTLPHAQRLGCPLRQAITELDRPTVRSQGRDYFGLAPDGPVLLVFGITGAARSTVPWPALPALLAAGSRCCMPSAPPGRPVDRHARLSPGSSTVWICVRGRRFAVPIGGQPCAEVAAVGCSCLRPVPGRQWRAATERGSRGDRRGGTDRRRGVDGRTTAIDLPRSAG